MSLTYDIKTKLPKPKWYNFRHRLSNILLSMAKKVYPENPDVLAFYLKQITDAMIYGGCVTHIDYADFLKEQKTTD